MMQAQKVRRRDFEEIMWQIAEHRCCDEVTVLYTCGHTICAEVWVPALPRTQEYTNHEADRRRFMQHSMFVLTNGADASRVQISVPEGRCRHCMRGEREALFCGALRMDFGEERRREQQQLAEAARAKAAGRGGDAHREAAVAVAAATALMISNLAQARRLELPLSSHLFFAAMGRVCQHPDSVTLPPLLHSASQGGGTLLFGGPALPRDLQPWSRRDVEDRIKAEVMKYVGGATFIWLFLLVECIFLCVLHLDPGNGGAADAAAASLSPFPVAALNFSSLVRAQDGTPGGVDAAWLLSALTLTVHRAFGLAQDDALPGAPPSAWWTWVGYPCCLGASRLLSPLLWLLSWVLYPCWLGISVLLPPLLWLLDLVLALPRFLLIHVVLASGRALVWRPGKWMHVVFGEVLGKSAGFFFTCALARPIVVLTQLPVANPMAVAMALSLAVAAYSVPWPPRLPLAPAPAGGGAGGALPASAPSKGGGPMAFWFRAHFESLWQRLRCHWASLRKDRGASGRGGAQNGRGQKRRDAPATERALNGRDGSQAGHRDGRSNSSAYLPACFLCLDRPSRYVLEPCGHRVVCGDCAVQLVEAAGRQRDRSMGEANGAQHAYEKGGGACPSCGGVVARAMRVFS